MQHKKNIRNELDFTLTFKIIAQAYQEIAVMRMRHIRASVLSTREYLSKLSEVFVDVKKVYQRELKERKKMKAPPQVFAEKRKKSVTLLLSANTKLYGEIVNSVFKLFLERSQKDESEIIIIGRWGKHLYEEQNLKKPYLYFEIPDTKVTIEYLKPVLFHLTHYEKIYVYYGKFKNIATQEAVMSNVSGDQSFSEEAQKLEISQPEEFLFEPSLERIREFFVGLVATSLFKQTVYESELALLASRVMAMEIAQDNINQALRTIRLQKKKLFRLEENKKQLERFSGMSLWSKL